MLKSMTGFSAQHAESKHKLIHIELKSVNHRYLDIQCKLPEELKSFEQLIKNTLMQQITRGKLECKIQYTNKYTEESEIVINEVLVEKLAKINLKIIKEHKKIKPLSVADLLKFPGVLKQDDNHDDDLPIIIQSVLKSSIEDFNQSRLREGERLKEHLQERLASMTVLLDKIQIDFPLLVQQHIEKSEKRLLEAFDNFDDDRLKQEFALFMQKADVDEEFSRLRAHIAEIEHIINQENSQPVGKRLDFLMQELNREANTLGSKSIAIQCTQTSIELKVLIEQMREQIQNIE